MLRRPAGFHIYYVFSFHKSLLHPNNCLNLWEQNDQILLVMVDVCAETEIRELLPKTFVPLPKEFWDNKKTIDDIFDAIAAATDPKIKEEKVWHFIEPSNILCMLWLTPAGFDNRISCP